MNIKLKLREINALIPVMGKIFGISLPYEIAFQLFKTGKKLDEANDYFVKEIKKIQDANGEDAENEIGKLGNTTVELNCPYLDKHLLFNSLMVAAPELPASDLLMLEMITEHEDEESFKIVE